jgi:hypothetical protein
MFFQIDLPGNKCCKTVAGSNVDKPCMLPFKTSTTIAMLMIPDPGAQQRWIEMIITLLEKETGANVGLNVHLPVRLCISRRIFLYLQLPYCNTNFTCQSIFIIVDEDKKASELTNAAVDAK